MSNSGVVQTGLSEETVSSLTRLAAKVDEIEFLLDTVGGLLHRGPEIADNIGASVHEMRESLVAGDGASVSHADIQTIPRLQSITKAENLDKLLSAVESLTQVLSSPQVQSFLVSDALPATESLTRLASRAEELEYLLEMIGGLIRRGPDIADNLNDAVNDVRASFGKSSEGAAQLSNTLQKAKSLITPENIDRMVGLFDMLQSTILDEKTISMVSSMGEALVESSESTNSKDTSISGIFQLMRALKDPDVARTLGFALEFAKAFGKKLK